MRLRLTIVAVTLGLFAASPASAYDGLENDFATCTSGQGKVDDGDIVNACTRLIDNADKENELVGFFYAMRATSNSNKESNCRDAKKVLKLTQDPAVQAGANELVKINC